MGIFSAVGGYFREGEGKILEPLFLRRGKAMWSSRIPRRFL